MGAYAPHYGYYHRIVQAHIIKANDQMKFNPEQRVGDTLLRADLFSTTTHEIYEIKPNRPDHIVVGGIQLANYVDLSNGEMRPGITPLALPPIDPISFGKVTVTIHIEQRGSLLLYSLEQHTNPSKSKLEKNNSTVPALFIAALTMGVAGSHSSGRSVGGAWGVTVTNFCAE